MTEIPSSFYVIIGSLVITNIGTVVTVMYGVGKLVWWLSETNTKLKTLKDETLPAVKKDVDFAHTKIREIEKLNYNNKGT